MSVPFQTAPTPELCVLGHTLARLTMALPGLQHTELQEPVIHILLAEAGQRCMGEVT